MTAPAAPPPPVDDVHAQRARLIAWLRAHGPTSCPALADACDVPSVTSRVSELIRDGWPIRRIGGRLLTKRGAWRRTTIYELTGPAPQADLFDPA